MSPLIHSGPGWRLGWKPEEGDFPGLVGAEDWSLELTGTEMRDFYRLLGQLTAALGETFLMPGEQITCTVESELLWLELEGDPQLTYTLHLILHQGRRGEGWWRGAKIPELLAVLGQFVLC